MSCGPIEAHCAKYMEKIQRKQIPKIPGDACAKKCEFSIQVQLENLKLTADLLVGTAVV